MKNTFGNAISVTLFGESHGEAIGVVIDGLAPGMKIDREAISAMLTLRRPQGNISTARVEADEYRIVSGEMNGYATGAPLTIIIPNENISSKDYSKIKDTPRPSHADYAAHCKYHGYEDYRGGGHFSGRITAPLVAAGAILTSALKEKGIYIGTHIALLHGIFDVEFGDIYSDIKALASKSFPALSDDAAEKMKNEITKAKNNGDSVGGVLESAIIGIPAGVGEPWFDSVESVISHLLFSVGGVKGVEFGEGFGFANLFGSEANDPFCVKDGVVMTKTNNAGGINGGITNGMPIIVRCAVKPTSSIYKAQQTVNLNTMSEEELAIEGRHDPAIIHRVKVVVDALLAIAVADLLTQRFGTDYLSSKQG